MRKQYVVSYPEYIPKKKEPITTDQMAKNREYNKIAAQHNATNRREMLEAKLECQRLNSRRVKHAGGIIFENLDRRFKPSSKSLDRIDRINLLRLPLSDEFVENFGEERLSDFPVRDLDMAYTIPIYININEVPFYEEKNPWILGYLGGIYSRKDRYYAKIIPSMEEEDYVWIYQTHYNFELKLHRSGKWYVSTGRQLHMHLKPATNPISNREYCETELKQLSKILTDIETLNKLVRQNESKITKFKDNARWFAGLIKCTNDVEVQRQYRRVISMYTGRIDDLEADKATFEKQLEEANAELTKFHESHIDLPEGTLIWDIHSSL